MDSPPGPRVNLPGVGHSRSAVEKTSSWLLGMSSEDDSHSNYHNSWAQELETTRGEIANTSRSPGKLNGIGGSAKGTHGMSGKNDHVNNSMAETMTSEEGQNLGDHCEHNNGWSEELAKHEALLNCKPTIATNREKYENEELPALAMIVPKMRDVLQPAGPKMGQRIRAATEPWHSKKAAHKLDAIVFGTGMNPTKTGSYGVVGKAELKEAHGFARVVSHQAVLENAVNQYENPAEYSPSVYGGVWENDPKVGLTLPPFSPDMKTSMSSEPEKAISKHSINEPSHETTVPAVARFAQRLAVPSLDSITSSAQLQHPSAEVLPLFGLDSKVNSVPAPPTTFPEFEPAKIFDFARLEQSLHHHIDARFERLSRLVVERSDKVIDEVSKMMETWEEKLQNGLRGSLKQDLITLKCEFENLGHELNSISANTMESKRALQAMNNRMTGLEVSVREGVCQCGDPGFRQDALIMSASMPEVDVPHQQVEKLSKLDMNALVTTPIGEKGVDEARQWMATDNGHGNPAVATEQDARGFGDEEHSVPLGIRGPNDVLYELPSFLSLDEHGNAVVNLHQMEGPMPVPGIRGPNGVLYELPSFMGISEDGDAVVNLPPVEGPMPVPGIHGPNGVLYELPSFMGISEDGDAVVNLPPVEGPTTVPGIRGPNGVLYELPSFMAIGEDGEPEMNPGHLEAEDVAGIRGWVEGPNGETDIETAINTMLSCILPPQHQE